MVNHGVAGMARTEEQIRLAVALKQALLDAYDPEAVILFGSLGRGDADEFSDVDLLLVMETDRDAKELSEEMTEYLTPLSEDKHIIVRTPVDFFRQRDIPGTIVFSAVAEGQILFEKMEWRSRALPVDPYDKRKKEVIREEYERSAHDFLALAESSFQKGTLFRCRDFARFAALRALKGLFVKHDIHPPRVTDLVILLNEANQLEPDVVQHAAFVRELNGYCPEETGDAAESLRIRSMVKRTAGFVREIVARYGLD